VSSSGDDPPLSEGGTKPLRDATADTLRKSAEYRRRLTSRSEAFGPGYRMTDAEHEGRWFVDHGHAPTADELSLSCSRVGRNEAPQLIFFLDWNYLLTDEALTANIANVWSSCDGPELRSNHDLWRDYFERAGYTVNGKPADRPPEFRSTRFISPAVNERMSDRTAVGTWLIAPTTRGPRASFTGGGSRAPLSSRRRAGAGRSRATSSGARRGDHQPEAGRISHGNFGRGDFHPGHSSARRRAVD
jgi:hypothetical protein